jgi:hypothetical protein
MGKQAKRKQARDRSLPKDPRESYEATEFIREIQQQGYQFNKIQRSPDLPSNKAEPQL